MFKEKIIHQSLRIAMLSVLGLGMTSMALANDTMIISNMATGEYKEEGSTLVQTSRSNLVQTTIIPAYSFTLLNNNNVYGVANQPVYFNHVLTNTSNAKDSYNLNIDNVSELIFQEGYAIYLDKNRDGIPDNDQPITRYVLNAGESIALVIKALLGTATANATGSLKLTATSAQLGTAGVISNTDTVTISDQAVMMIRKAFNKSTVVANDEAIVRLTYFNNGTESGEVNITDVLNTAELTYVSGSEVWNGQALNATSGTNDPTGIDYFWDETTKTVKAKISNVPANAQGYIEFKVRVVKQSLGQIPNQATLDFDHDKNNSTSAVKTQSNIAVLEILPRYGVVINADATGSAGSDIDDQGQVTTGSTVLFRNWVWNTGNALDRFNLTLGSHNFPTGTVLEFYRQDGITPIFDSNGDGIVDTGYLAAGAGFPVVVKATFPKDHIDNANTVFKVEPQAQSIGDVSKTDTVIDQVELSQNIASRTVDLTNQSNNSGLGNGSVSNGISPWITLDGENSQTITFPLKVSHVGLATAYQLSADDDGDFSTVRLPNGIQSIRYFETLDNCLNKTKEISSTQVLQDGDTQTYCAVLSIDAKALASTSNVYFKVASSALPSPYAQYGYDVIHNAIQISSKTSQGEIALDPDLRGQIAPGGTITYSHILKQWGSQTLKTTDTLTVENDQQGFIATLYFDKNDNGVLDSNDVIMTDLSVVPTATLTAQKPIRIFAKVENSSYGMVGVSNTSVILLKDGNTTVDSATDITTITTSPIRLTKLQAKDDDCNGIEDGSFTTNVLPITKNSNGSGQCVIYQLIVKNMGASDIGKFTFYDTTPEAMVMSKAPVCADCDTGSITAPVIGQSGAIQGSVTAVKSGANHSLEFGVKYVGN